MGTTVMTDICEEEVSNKSATRCSDSDIEAKASLTSDIYKDDQLDAEQGLYIIVMRSILAKLALC